MFFTVRAPAEVVISAAKEDYIRQTNINL